MLRFNIESITVMFDLIWSWVMFDLMWMTWLLMWSWVVFDLIYDLIRLESITVLNKRFSKS